MEDNIRLRVTLPYESATFDFTTPPNPLSGTYSYTAPPGGTDGTFVEYIELFAPSPVGSLVVCVIDHTVNGIGTDAFTLTITEGGVLKYGGSILPGDCLYPYFYPNDFA